MLRHSLCNTVQLQLRSAGWERGRAFLGNMPRWADLIIGGWKTSASRRISDGRPLPFFLNDGGQPLPTMAHSDPILWERPSVTTVRIGWTTTLRINSVFQRPAILHPVVSSA